MKNSSMLGAMIDCSRNAVMIVKAVKDFVDILAKMGYNTLMLYTEDTYEISNQPYFGYMRGRYTKDELKEIDAYCNAQGIELIPCIQTLAHLNGMFKWGHAYADINDCDDILLIDEEKTYRLIEDMLSTASECFTSKRIHIGMDEAYRVGLGQYLAKHGYAERFDLINRHLHKVCALADKYGFHPMIWSDMFCKLAVNSQDYHQANDPEAIRKKADLPQNITLVYWDYYSTDYNNYVRNIHGNQAFDRPVIFAGGAWTWRGFAPDNRYSMETTAPAVKACKDCGVNDMFFTLWGDDGGECSRYGVLPSLLYAAEAAKGNHDMESIKQKFKDIVGMDFESFMLLDKMDIRLGGHDNNHAPSKYLFYNDPFMGLNDYRVSGCENGYYADLKNEIDRLAVTEKYKPVFSCASAFCDALSVKSDLGIHTRSAYAAGDKMALRQIAETEYLTAIEKISAFHKAYQSFWFDENKPHGFDIQDMRIGGVLQRLKSCRERLLAYCEGAVARIPELEEALLPNDCGVHWSRYITANVITMHL